ncbi:hypothetical protein LY90DRAFT_665460 [Neocallimastix californiae]|uniref:Cyclin N-terminal domain-containing protein n=1 Tax=Neocallimastix californiae TaxID=1754190 RepID=A0A1Y2F196_9FUNG|nr:hypothetical protein LY90DRAFT_665460 [Neocallimastix californiae]|eukprot:ORY76735.1 hypothetical protein LY90DRAFT_665460 [Neocallimastix californiae]
MSKCNYFGRKLPYGIYPVVIDLLANYASDIVSCRKDEYDTSTVGLLPLPEFIKQILDKSGINNILEILTTIIYMKRLKLRLSPISTGLSCTKHRIFLATLIISQKYTQDVPYRNLDWSYITPFTLEDINLMERQLLYKLNYDLQFSEDEVANLYFYTISKMINSTSLSYTYNSFPNIEAIYKDPSICVIDINRHASYKNDIVAENKIMNSNEINNPNINYSKNKDNSNSKNNIYHNSNINKNRKTHVVLSNEDSNNNMNNYNNNINKNTKKENISEINNNYSYKYKYHETDANPQINISSQIHNSNLNMLNNLNIDKRKNIIINNINQNYYNKENSYYNSNPNSNTSFNNTSSNYNNNKNITINLMNNYEKNYNENNINKNMDATNTTTSNDNIQKNKILFINEKSEVHSNYLTDSGKYICDINNKYNENINISHVSCYNISQASDSSDDDEYFFEKYENKSFNNSKKMNNNLNTNYYDSNKLINIKQSNSNNNNNNFNNIKNIVNNLCNSNNNYQYHQSISKNININTKAPTSVSINSTSENNQTLNKINVNVNDINLNKGYDHSNNSMNYNSYNNKASSYSSNSSNPYDYCYHFDYGNYTGKSINAANDNINKIQDNNYCYSQLNQYSFKEYSNSTTSNNNITESNDNTLPNKNTISNNSKFSNSSILSINKNEHKIYPSIENSILSDVNKAFSSIKLLSTSSSSSSLYSSDKSDIINYKYGFNKGNVNHQNISSMKKPINTIPSSNTAFTKVEIQRQQQPTFSNNLLNSNTFGCYIPSNSNTDASYTNKNTSNSNNNNNNNYEVNLNSSISKSLNSMSINSTSLSNKNINENTINDTDNTVNTTNSIYLNNSNINEEAFNNKFKMNEHQILYGDIFYENKKYKILNDILNDNKVTNNNYYLDSQSDIIINHRKHCDDGIDNDSDSLYHSSESENYFSQDEECECFNHNVNQYETFGDNKIVEDPLNLIHGVNDSENYFSQGSDFVFNNNASLDSPLKSEASDLKCQKINFNEDNSLSKTEINHDDIIADTNVKKENVFKFCNSCSSQCSLNSNEFVNSYKQDNKNRFSFIDVLNDTIHEVNSHKNNINNISTFASLFSSSKITTSSNISNSKNNSLLSNSFINKSNKTKNDTNIKNNVNNEEKTKNNTIPDDNVLNIQNNDTKINSNKCINNNINSSSLKVTNESQNDKEGINEKNNEKMNYIMNNKSRNNSINIQEIPINSNNKNDDNNINSNKNKRKKKKKRKRKKKKRRKWKWKWKLKRKKRKKMKKRKKKKKKVKEHLSSFEDNSSSNLSNLSSRNNSASSIQRDDSKNSIDECKTVFEYICNKEKKLKIKTKSAINSEGNNVNKSAEINTEKNSTHENINVNSIKYENSSDNNINDKDMNDNHHSFTVEENEVHSYKFIDIPIPYTNNRNHESTEKQENNFDKLKEDTKDTDYESSYLNDTPSITSKIQRLDDMLEYCSLKHNYIINNNTTKKDGIFHSNSNEENNHTEKSYLHSIRSNDKIDNSTVTTHSLNNLTSTLGANPIFLNNHLSSNFDSSNITNSSYLGNSSNLTLTSDKDNNESQYSIHHSSAYTYSQNFNIGDKNGTGSEPLLKHPIFLKSDSVNSSHTILQQDKDNDYIDFDGSINLNFDHPDNSTNHVNKSTNNINFNNEKSYKVNLSYDSENNYYSLESFKNSTSSSVYNSSISSPMNNNSIKSKSSFSKIQNMPIHCGLHKSQRIENFQYYRSSSDESINNI